MEATNQGLGQALKGLWDAIEPYLAAERIELDDLEMVGRGGARTLRVVIDGENVDLDRIAHVSRGLSRLLDGLEEQTDLEGSYQLEVTSPGLERKLNKPRHFQKSVGREVIVKTDGGSRRGVLTDADEESLSLQVDDGLESIPYSNVVSARTVFTWEKPPKPGARKQDKPRSS